MKLLLISLFTIFIGCQKESAESAKYILDLDVDVDPDCRLSIYIDEGQTHFIIKRFSPDKLVTHESYQGNLNYNLNAETKKIYFNKLISKTSTKHTFKIVNRNLFINYQEGDTNKNLQFERDLSCK